MGDKASLAKLLMDLFSASELDRFVRRGPYGDEIAGELPTPHLGLARYTDELIDQLERRGLLNAELFAALEARRREKPPSPQERRAALVFIAGDAKDDEHRASLERSLGALRRQQIVRLWHAGMVRADQDWRAEAERHIEAAALVLLLISADFLDSSHCMDIEVPRAMARHDAGLASVIPIYLRPCDWTGAPFGHLRGVPDPRRPLTSWSDRDQAWTEVARAIREVVTR